MTIQGKTALVTGGASVVGAGIVRALAAAGARVCVADPNIDAARAIAHDVDGLAIMLDPLSDASFARLAYDLADAWGDVDILVNGFASSQAQRPLEEMPEADFDRIATLNTRPIYLATRHIVPAMKAGRGGVILNIAATSGLYSKSRPGWQSACKAWVVAATEAMAVEFADHGIRVNALAPVVDDSPPVPSFLGGAKSSARQQALGFVPLGRFAGPVDLGEAAVFLCSDAAALVTGVTLPIDGGRRL
jgi:3-oxoacyl-[acyl-carrier protein] reductase